jgi:hypothetical protein
VNRSLRECKAKRSTSGCLHRLPNIRGRPLTRPNHLSNTGPNTGREIPHRNNDCADAKRRRLITKCFPIFLDLPQISRANKSLAM